MKHNRKLYWPFSILFIFILVNFCCKTNIELNDNNLDQLSLYLDKKESIKNDTSIEKEMISLLGTKVSVKHKKNGSGSLMIKYYSNDDLERLLELLKSIEKNK